MLQVRSIQLVLDSAADLQRNIKVETNGQQRDVSLKNCATNLEELRRAVGDIQDIHKETVVKYHKLKCALKQFDSHVK